MIKMETYLGKLIELGAGDLLLSPSRPPWFRGAAGPRPLEGEPASPEDIGEVWLKLAPSARREAFKRDGVVEFAAEAEGLGRFRFHVFRERLGTAAIVRLIPETVPSPEELGLPDAALALCSDAARSNAGGLVVVAGPAGSGKSTTLAAMVCAMGHGRAAHVVTIEDPIEFVHDPNGALIHQREVGTHCGSLAEGVSAAVREGADVVLVGGIPDADTAGAALQAAASGCLVLAELAVSTTALAIERLLCLLPDDRRDLARAALASSLSGVVVQRLLPRADGKGPVAAVEVVVSTPAIAEAIRGGRSPDVAAAVQAAGKREGAKLLDDALLELLVAGKAKGADALGLSLNRQEFRRKCYGAGVDLGEEATAAGSGEESQQAQRRTQRAAVLTRRMSRAEMFQGTATPKRRERSRSRTARFSDDTVPPSEETGVAGVEHQASSDEPTHPQEAGGVVAGPEGVGLPGVAGRKVIVVDDDDAVRDLLVRILRTAGAQVKALGQPRQALAEVESGSYDLAMFDVMMPGMSGTELYDRTVGSGLAPGLRDRVLFVTGCKIEGALRDCIAARGGRVLQKPLGAQELLAVAARILDPARKASRAAHRAWAG